LILYDGREPDGLDRAEALAGRILEMCVAMGGSLTGEHGIGVEKRDHMPAMFSADELDCMERLRAAFDPLGIANPGKMFPSGAAALSRAGLHPLERAGVISRE
jgi:glycolate oxidase